MRDGMRASTASGVTLAIAALVGVGGCSVYSYVDPAGPRFAGIAAEPAPDREPDVRVVSFNVQFAEHVDRAIEALRTRESLADADVVLLQEMNDPGAAAIADALGFHYVYYPATERGNGGFGNAVVSRWPIVEDHKLLLPHPSPANGERRVAVAATLDAPFGRIAVVSVHSETPWMPMRGRLEQLGAVLEDVEARYGASGIPVIVGGDFNTPESWGTEAIRGLFTVHGFTHASRDVPPTADYFVQQVTLDYVFVRGLHVEAAGVEDTDASDHRPVFVRARAPGEG